MIHEYGGEWGQHCTESRGKGFDTVLEGPNSECGNDEADEQNEVVSEEEALYEFSMATSMTPVIRPIAAKNSMKI
jgi:hypothetical protein